MASQDVMQEYDFNALYKEIQPSLFSSWKQMEPLPHERVIKSWMYVLERNDVEVICEFKGCDLPCQKEAFYRLVADARLQFIECGHETHATNKLLRLVGTSLYTQLMRCKLNPDHLPHTVSHCGGIVLEYQSSHSSQSDVLSEEELIFDGDFDDVPKMEGVGR